MQKWERGEDFNWTPEQINLLRQLKGRGYSATQVAKQIGGGLTRNAVIGKLYRLGLLVRSPKTGRTRDQSKDPVNVNKAKATDVSPSELLAVRRFSWERADANP